MSTPLYKIKDQVENIKYYFVLYAKYKSTTMTTVLIF